MALTLPYPTYTPFSATTVHSYTDHNTPHAGLLSNDAYLASQIDTTNTNVTNLTSSVGAINPGYIESVYVGQASGPGTYPNFTASKSYNYYYSGAYIPVSLLIAVVLQGAGSATCRNQIRWANSAGTAMTSWVDFVGLNPWSGTDGGANLNDTFSCNVPFIVGSRFIEWQDYHYTTRASWFILTLTYQKLTRPAAWGY